MNHSDENRQTGSGRYVVGPSRSVTSQTSARWIDRAVDMMPRPVRYTWRTLNAVLLRTFAPDYRFGQRDPALATVQNTQRVLGLVITAYASYRVLNPAAVAGWLNDGFSTWLNALLLTAAIYAALLLGACCILISVAGRGRRVAMAHLLERPIGTLLTSCVVVGLIALFALSGSLWRGWIGNVMKHESFVVQLIGLCLLLLSLVALIVTAVVLIRVVQLGAEHRFRAVDGHPTLPALTDLGMALWAGAIGLKTLVDGHVDSHAWAANVGFLAIGPCVTTSLAIWELHRLKTHRSVTFTWLPISRSTENPAQRPHVSLPRL